MVFVMMNKKGGTVERLVYYCDSSSCGQKVGFCLRRKRKRFAVLEAVKAVSISRRRRKRFAV